jgi:hypothetical protein
MRAAAPSVPVLPPSGGAVAPEPRVLAPGHFVVSLDADRGTYSRTVRATAPDGTPLETTVDLPIE